MVLELLEEKQLFLLSAVPPFLLTLLILRGLRVNPETIVQFLKTLVPSLKEVKVHEKVFIYLVIETRRSSTLADPFALLDLPQGATSVENINAKHEGFAEEDPPHCLKEKPAGRHNANSVRSFEPEFCDEMPAKSAQIQEIWANTKHFTRASLVPVLALTFFFWDDAILHRRASEEYPMLHCMENAHCFYIEQQYSVFKWPHYHRLQCTVDRSETSETSGRFYFQAPPSARFYKCYQNMISFNTLVGACGDVMALSAVAGIIIVHFSFQFNWTKDICENVIEKRIFHTRVQLVCAAVGFVFSLFTVHWFYGKVTNDIEFYLFFPSMCMFMFLLVLNRHELLNTMLKQSMKDRNDPNKGTFACLGEWFDCPFDGPVDVGYAAKVEDTPRIEEHVPFGELEKPGSVVALPPEVLSRQDTKTHGQKSYLALPMVNCRDYSRADSPKTPVTMASSSALSPGHRGFVSPPSGSTLRDNMLRSPIANGPWGSDRGFAHFRTGQTNGFRGRPHDPQTMFEFR